MRAIPADFPPPRSQPCGSDTVADLIAGITATSDRLSYLARHSGEAQQVRSAASWRQAALAAAIISHNSDLVLRSLTGRASALNLSPDYGAQLDHACELMRQACDSWQAITVAWAPIVTASRGRHSQIAAELPDLVLWMGRLAHANTDWTPARANAGPLRDPGDLAFTARDLTAALSATADAAHALTQIARQDHRAITATAAAQDLYMPSRLLPEDDDRTFIYRYHHAAPAQADRLLTGYRHAISAARRSAAALDALALAGHPPVPPRVLARTLTRDPAPAPGRAEIRPQRPSAPDSVAGRPAKDEGQFQRLARERQISDPALLLRAALLDHAAALLTREITSKTERRPDTGTAAATSPAPGDYRQRNRSIAAVKQDQPARPNGSPQTSATRPAVPRPAARRTPTKTPATNRA